MDIFVNKGKGDGIIRISTSFGGYMLTTRMLLLKLILADQESGFLAKMFMAVEVLLHGVKQTPSPRVVGLLKEALASNGYFAWVVSVEKDSFCLVQKGMDSNLSFLSHLFLGDTLSPTDPLVTKCVTSYVSVEGSPKKGDLVFVNGQIAKTLEG